MRLQQSDETALISDVPPGSDHTASCNLGVIGLATMGANLARNAALRGNSVAIYNRHSKRTTTLVDRHGGEGRFTPCETLEAFVSALRRPRSIIISVAAGPPVDVIIEQLVPLLDPDDILIGSVSVSPSWPRISHRTLSGTLPFNMDDAAPRKLWTSLSRQAPPIRCRQLVPSGNAHVRSLPKMLL